jgi:hypothetical protein
MTAPGAQPSTLVCALPRSSPAAMKHLAALVAFVSLTPIHAAAQEQPPAASPARDGWVQGVGSGPSQRAALANALEDAIGRRHGVRIVRGPGIRSRLAVVAKEVEAKDARLPAEAELEHEWVARQLDGVIETYEVTRSERQADGRCDVEVSAKVAAFTPGKDAFVVDLVDDDLRQWRLERFEEGAAGGPFDRLDGAYDAPSIRENLRATQRVKFTAKGSGVKADGDTALRERAKLGQQLVASHRVVVGWQPMQFRSEVERPNRARPTSGPRPQRLVAGSVRVTVKVVDLVEDVDLFDRALNVDLVVPPETPVERLDAMAIQLGDQAKAAVAEAIFFALQPPVVTRKWADEAGAWLVEAAVGRRVAAAYDGFSVGAMGSLASPDWRPVGRAVYVGGDDAKCTFRLVDVADPALVEVGVSEVRPARK